MKEGWKAHIEDCIMYHVVRKLKLLKKKLRVFHVEDFKNIVSEANVDREKLNHTPIQQNEYPYSIDFQQRESQLYEKLSTTSYMAELFLQQRSKASWIRLGC